MCRLPALRARALAVDGSRDTLWAICGPVLGGFLYQAGCWSLPFTVGGSLLFVAVFLLMVGLGRRAPKKLRPNKEHMMSMWQLLGVRDVAWLALPMVMVCMETSLMEPAWQAFLGRAPFHMGPQAIGAFLYYAIMICEQLARTHFPGAVSLSRLEHALRTMCSPAFTSAANRAHARAQIWPSWCSAAYALACWARRCSTFSVRSCRAWA